MKHSFLVGLALVATAIAMPLQASAVEQVTATGTVCGHVEAAPSRIFALQYLMTPYNYISARSASEFVQTTVNLDGTYCFKDLHTDMHRLTAFGDGSPEFTASILPVEGKTLRLDLYANRY